MDITNTNRRSLMIGAAAAAVLAPMRESIAQTEAAGGDWFAMVQAHHAMIAKTFDDLLASSGRSFADNMTLLKQLTYQLTAHSVAEENVIYPAMAMNGMATESDKLYIDQAHAKVGDADVNTSALMGADRALVIGKIKALQAAVLKHAKEDEEANYFPKLRRSLDGQRNAMLTTQYKEQFSSVRPV